MKAFAPAALVAVEQPLEWVVSVDGIFIKQIRLDRKGYTVPQHVHAYDHHSMLATGAVRAWADGELLGDFVAPRPIFIAAGKQHTFLALEDRTLLYCVHNLHGEDDVTLIAEAAFEGVI